MRLAVCRRIELFDQAPQSGRSTYPVQDLRLHQLAALETAAGDLAICKRRRPGAAPADSATRGDAIGFFRASGPSPVSRVTRMPMGLAGGGQVAAAAVEAETLHVFEQGVLADLRPDLREQGTELVSALSRVSPE